MRNKTNASSSSTKAQSATETDLKTKTVNKIEPSEQAHPHVPPATLVVALYNHAPYLDKALASAFNQEGIKYDVIITDDASADGTQQRVMDLLRENGWNARTLFHSQNRGICATFNEALAQVRTPYVSFISGDDWQASNRLAVLACALDQSPDVALVYSDMEIANANGELTGELYSDRFLNGWKDRDEEEPFLSLIEKQWVPTPSVMARTDAIRAVGGYNERLTFEDRDMWLKLAWHKPFAFVNEPLVAYRIHDQSLYRSLRSQSHIKRWESDLEIFSPYIGQDPAVDRLLIPKLYRSALSAFLDGENSESIRQALSRQAHMSREVQPWIFYVLATSRMPLRFARQSRSLFGRLLSISRAWNGPP